jgi:hypothetical protein
MNKTETTVIRTRIAESITGASSRSMMIALPIPLAQHYHHHQQHHTSQHASQYSSQYSSQQHEHAQTYRLHGDVNASVLNGQPHYYPPQPINHGPNTTPMVLKSNKGEIHIAMKINGIVSSYCVRMIKTILKGINTNSDNNRILVVRGVVAVPSIVC